MTEIVASGKRSAEIPAPLVEVFELLLDVPRVGMFWPGVERIDDLGDGRYRWTNEPRSAVGKTFYAVYVALYENNGRDEITFRSVEGNTDTHGSWRLRAVGDRTLVSVEVSSTVDIPIPRLLRKPAQLFAAREVRSGIDKQLQQIGIALARG